LIVACVFTLFFCPRSKFFYFLSVFLIEKAGNSFLKLAYAEPRPYMIEFKIKPVGCSKAFGSPSGHASSAILIFIVAFLDFFHGLPVKSKRFNP
jgi:membrane-associated phospholipid phosphatase